MPSHQERVRRSGLPAGYQFPTPVLIPREWTPDEQRVREAIRRQMESSGWFLRAMRHVDSALDQTAPIVDTHNKGGN